MNVKIILICSYIEQHTEESLYITEKYINLINHLHCKSILLSRI
jgi:hypothetical protein